MNGLIATIYIVSTGSAGAIIWICFVNNRKPSLIELSGIGLVISTISIAILNLLYRALHTGVAIASLVFVLLSIAYLIFSDLQIHDIDTESTVSFLFSISIFGVFISGYLSALSSYFYPLFVTFVILSAFNGFKSKTSDYFALFASSAILIIGVMVTKYLQVVNESLNPSWRWVSNDAIYDTSQSVGVGRYGLAENIFSAGNQNKGYLLVYSWSGDFANITRIPHLEIATISFAVVALLGICCCTIAICKSLKIPNFVAYLICGSVLFQSSFPESNLGGEYLKINNMITLLWLIGFLHIIVISKIHTSKRLVFATYAIPPIIMMGKFHFGVLAVIILVAATDLYDRDKTSLWSFKSMNLLHVGASLCSLFISFLAFKLLIDFPNRWPNRFPFDPQFLRWSIILFLFRFLGIRLSNFVNWLNLRRIINYLTLFSLCFYVFSSGANNSIYFISGSLAVASFGMFTVLYKSRDYSIKDHLLMYLAAPTMAAAISFIAFADYTISYFGFLSSPTSGFRFDIYTKYLYLVQPILISCMVIFIYLCLAVSSKFNHVSMRKGFGKLLVLTIFASNLGFFLFLPFRPILLNHIYDANEYQIFPVDSRIVEGLVFVRSNTHHDSIIASNRLCNAEIGSRNETPGWPAGTLPACGNINFLSPVSALSERRQLMEAPVFNNTIGPYLDTDSVFRYRLIQRFFTTPSIEDFEILRSYSVTLLFIDKTLPWSEELNHYGEVIFENTSALVISI